MRRLKVWVVTPELHRQGGTERCLSEQIERWRERFDLRIYTMHVEGVNLEGVPIRRVPRLPGPHLFRYCWWFVANTLLRTWDAVRLGRPDAVYSPGINAADADVIAIHMVFAKYWERVRDEVLRDLLGPRRAPRVLHRLLYWAIVRYLERRFYGGPATIWALSREDSHEIRLRYRPEVDVPVISNGVDADHFHPGLVRVRREEARRKLKLTDEFVVLLVGNDAYKKGVDVAVTALRELSTRVVLAVAGNVDRELVKAWARESGVSNRVYLWPHTSDVIGYYAAADCVIVPSREEASPLPPLEAMACGLPVVIDSRAGAVAELVEDGRHVLVLKTPEDARELAWAVRRILTEPQLSERLSREGRTLAEGHSWDFNAERAAALIERESTTPRVLVLAPHARGTGGIERATRTLLRVLADRYGEERVGLLSVWGGRGSLPCRTLWEGFLGEGATPVPLAVKIRFAAAALTAARRWRSRLVIFACHPYLAPIARLCAWVSGAPYVVWCYGREVWEPLRLDRRWAVGSANMVVTPSRFTASIVQQTSGIGDERVIVVPLALTKEISFPQLPRREPKVLAVARLVPEDAYKGIDTLIASWPQVIAAMPRAQLVITGDGPDRLRLEAEAMRQGLNGLVRFTGRLDDTALAMAYAESAVFALPARTKVGRDAGGEGFGLVFLEAAAAGLPVVAGNGGAIPEVVGDGETGLLVNPDSPTEVAAAIIRLLRDPDLAKRMGEAARRRVFEEFSFERFQQRVAGLIERVRREA